MLLNIIMMNLKTLIKNTVDKYESAYNVINIDTKDQRMTINMVLSIQYLHFKIWLLMAGATRTLIR